MRAHYQRVRPTPASSFLHDADGVRELGLGHCQWTLSGKTEFFEERRIMILLCFDCRQRGRGDGAGMSCPLWAREVSLSREEKSNDGRSGMD